MNKTYGTFVQDGVRSGPLYTFMWNDGNGGVYSTASFEKFGKGIPYSPNFTYRITPFESVEGNVCEAQNTAAAQYLGLNAGSTADLNNAATFKKDDDRNSEILFDWPRALKVETEGANLAAPVNVTVFGKDAYDFSMQETVVVQNVAAYNLKKAFAKVTSVYCGGVFAGANQIKITTQDTFGLPYVCSDSTDVISVGWDSEVLSPDDINTFLIKADSADATGTTGDVRGTFKLNLTNLNPANGLKNLKLTYYIAGADMNFNVYNSMGMQMWTPADGGSRIIIPALKMEGLYGVQQYYTGIPA